MMNKKTLRKLTMMRILTIIITVVWIVLNASPVLSNNATGFDGYLWYDNFNSISEWDCDTLTVGDESPCTEFVVENFNGNNVLRDNNTVNQTSGIELEETDVNIKDIPLLLSYMFYADNIQSQHFIQLFSTQFEYKHYLVTDVSVGGNDTIIIDYTGGGLGSIYESFSDINRSKWIGVSVYLDENNIEFYIDSELKQNITTDFITNQSTFNHIIIRSDTNKLRFDNFSLFYGQLPDIPINCTPIWNCSGYGSCINDTQFCNEVLDLNGCGESYTGNFSEFAPQSCITPTIPEENETAIVLSEDFENSSILYIILLLWLFCLLLGIATKEYFFVVVSVIIGVLATIYIWFNVLEFPRLLVGFFGIMNVYIIVALYKEVNE